MTDDQTGSASPIPRGYQPPGSVSLGLLVLRLFVGVAMAGHGAQKLFGLFGGAGLGGTADFFESVGYSPGTPYALLSGLVEVGGGLLLIVGLATPLAAAAITANMMGAYVVAQAAGPDDFFAAGQATGPELELFYVCAGFALILTGPGQLALRLPFLEGSKMRLLGLALAIAGSVGAVLVQNA